MSWHEVQIFAEKLSKAQGLDACKEREVSQCGGWCLPTETEWYVAARAGTRTATYHTKSKYNLVGERNAPNLEPITWYGVGTVASSTETVWIVAVGKASNASV